MEHFSAFLTRKCFLLFTATDLESFFFFIFFLVGSLENWNFPLGLDGVDSHEACAKLWIVAKKGFC